MFGAQAGGRFQLGQGTRLHLLVEDNVGTYYESQFRGLAVLELDAWTMRRSDLLARLGSGRRRGDGRRRGRGAGDRLGRLARHDAGGAGRAGRLRPPAASPLIYPAETIPIQFDHARHARARRALRDLPHGRRNVDGRPPTT